MLIELKKTIRAFKTRRLKFEFDKIPFYFKDLSWKRLINWFLAESAYRLKSPFAVAYPTLFQIEPNNLCNLRCPLCYTPIRSWIGTFLVATIGILNFLDDMNLI